MRTFLPVIALLFALVPETASAVTWQEVVALSKAGVPSQVIITLIDRDKTAFTITPDQIGALQNDGVSEEVLIAMLRSGLQESPEAGPTVVVVGRGPDRPSPTEFFVPYFVPVPYLVPLTAHSPCTTRAAARPPTSSSTTGIFFMTPFRGQFFGPAEPEGPSRGAGRCDGT